MHTENFTRARHFQRPFHKVQLGVSELQRSGPARAPPVTSSPRSSAGSRPSSPDSVFAEKSANSNCRNTRQAASSRVWPSASDARFLRTRRLRVDFVDGRVRPVAGLRHDRRKRVGVEFLARAPPAIAGSRCAPPDTSSGVPSSTARAGPGRRAAAPPRPPGRASAPGRPCGDRKGAPGPWDHLGIRAVDRGRGRLIGR